MSLVVHELLIGNGSEGGSKTSIKSPSNSVHVAQVSNSNVHTSLQQKVVTIMSHQSGLISTERSSKLPDTFAGFSLSSESINTSSKPRSVGHVVNCSSPCVVVSSCTAEYVKPVKTFLSNCRQNILPFVLQDHNYGAPPPTANTKFSPQKPSGFPFRPSQPYKFHQIFPPNTNSINSKSNIKSNSISLQNNYGTKSVKIIADDIHDVSKAEKESNIKRFAQEVSTVKSDVITSNPWVNMPLHQQQFMPNPKPSIYPSPYIPPLTSLINESSKEISVEENGSLLDTDDESRLSERSSSIGASGEETETAPEGEGDDQNQVDDSITRCICNFTHDDGYMIQCDRCFVWQHVDCMEIDRNNIPDEYLCEACKHRVTDKSKARALQIRRRQELRIHVAGFTSSDSDENEPFFRMKSLNKMQERKYMKKKKLKPHKEEKPPTSLSARRQSLSSKSNNNPLTSNSVSSVSKSEERSAKTTKRKKIRQNSQCGSSLSSCDESAVGVGPSVGPLFGADKLRAWIEDYEIAVTNHYSPELRAKVHAARINGISAEFRESTQAALLGHRCRVAPCYDAPPDSPEDKKLIAATRLKAGTAIIEYQGKYTLLSQLGVAQSPAHLPYMPFMLRYEMVKDGQEELTICVDARTYGNDARFSRRSLGHNAEIQHVVERGSVHLYIVSTKDIEEEEEILLSLETAVGLNNPSYKIPRNSQKPKNAVTKKQADLVNSSVPNTTIRKNNGINGVVQKCEKSIKKKVKKPHLSLSLSGHCGRSRRRTTSVECAKPAPAESPCKAAAVGHATSVSPQNEPPRKTLPSGPKSPAAMVAVAAKACLRSPCKSPSKYHTSTEESSSGESPTRGDRDEKSLDMSKMTREERKIAAYMKAFERMEKAAQRSERKKEEGRHRKNSQSDLVVSKSAKDHSKVEKEKNRRKGVKAASKRTDGDSCEESREDWSESEPASKPDDGLALDGSSSPYSSMANALGSRFLKTKKSLMNEWLNETVDPVLHSVSASGEVPAGVPMCYMRSPIRRASASGPGTAFEVDSRSAKKRWLRQAISEKSESESSSMFCSSPNSGPVSPTGNVVDCGTPLKKRRLARESMSSENSGSPSTTPQHSSFEERFYYEDDNENCPEMKGSKGKIFDEISISNFDCKREPSVDGDENKPEKPVEKLPFALPDIKLEVKSDIIDDTSYRLNSLLTNDAGKTIVKEEVIDHENKNTKKIKSDDALMDVDLGLKKENISQPSKSRKRLQRKMRKRIGKKSGRSTKAFSSRKGENKSSCNKLRGRSDLEDRGSRKADSFQSFDCDESQLNIETNEAFPPLFECKYFSNQSPGGLHCGEQRDTFPGNSCKDGLTKGSAEVEQEEVPGVETSLCDSPLKPVPPEDAESTRESTSSPKVPLTDSKPAAVKRKLSILEYRQRKSFTSEKDPKEECSSLVEDRNASLAERLNEVTWDADEVPASVGVVPARDFSPIAFAPPVPSPLPDKVLEEMDWSNEETVSAVKWNAAPTQLELQRENLTERLRRNFGLRVNGDNQSKFKLGITQKLRSMGRLFAEKKSAELSTATSLSRLEGAAKASKEGRGASSPPPDDFKPFPPPPLPAASHKSSPDRVESNVSESPSSQSAIADDDGRGPLVAPPSPTTAESRETRSHQPNSH